MKNIIRRREFLATTALAAAATPMAALAAETDPDPAVMGQGAFRYKRDTAWTFQAAENPVPVDDCHEFVRLKSGRLILCTTHTKNNLIEFDPSGKVVRTFGTTYPGAHGLSLSDENGEEFLWLTDTKRRLVVKLDLAGKEIMTLGWPKDTGKYTAENQFCPTETAVNPANGDLYVADGYGSNWLTHYSAKGEVKGCYKHDGFNCIHGVAYDAPIQRTREIIDICRKVWKREEPVVHDGKKFQLPLPAEKGTGLGKPLKIITHPRRADIPIHVASLGPKNVELTAELADGWLPILFHPERAGDVWGADLAAGAAKRPADLPPMDTIAGGLLAIGPESEVAGYRDFARAMVALYVGGMGARDRNFYNQLFTRYGYEAEAKEIQDLYLAGKKAEAAAAVPASFLEETSLCGDEGYVKERIAQFKDAGVTVLNVTPIAKDLEGQARLIEKVKELSA